eukprot:SAG22_NODE_6843_length_805_cov_0.645892_2_plen_72_part_00
MLEINDLSTVESKFGLNTRPIYCQPPAASCPAGILSPPPGRVNPVLHWGKTGRQLAVSLWSHSKESLCSNW